MSALSPSMRKEDRRSLQMAINEKARCRLKIDGDFGPASIAGLKKYQEVAGLQVTGVYDIPTFQLLDPFIREKYLVPEDYVKAAMDLGCQIASVHAVVEVEAAGDGFLPDGRCDILFERHKFYKYLGQKVTADELAAIAAANPDICNRDSGGYKGNELEYPRLEKAMKIHPWAAMMSASWGMFQIMGFNFATAGYPSVEEYVAAAQLSERNQLNAFVKFIKADKNLLNALRGLDWRTLARGYNGPGYAAHKYDIRLAAAFKKWTENPHA